MDRDLECLVCGARVRSLGRTVLIEKHDVEYFRCAGCGFIQTEDPYWLASAYKTDRMGCDCGMVTRNIRLSGFASAVIHALFDADGSFLDYGGGAGLLVRLMRDRGFRLA